MTDVEPTMDLLGAIIDRHIETDQYRTLICPLPVIRKKYDEQFDSFELVVGRCGEEISIEIADSHFLYADGVHDSTCGTFWKAECHAGHVLLVPDHEADDHFDQIPYGEVAHEALVELLARGHFV